MFSCFPADFHFIYYLTVWGVEPDVTHQTSWHESTNVYDVRQNQAGGRFAQKGGLSSY